MESPKEIGTWGGYLLRAWDPDFLLTYQGSHLCYVFETYVTPHVHSLRHHQLLFGLALYCLDAQAWKFNEGMKLLSDELQTSTCLHLRHSHPRTNALPSLA